MNKYFNLIYKLSDEEFSSILKEMDYFDKYSIINELENDPYEALALLLNSKEASKIFLELEAKGVKVASVLMKMIPEQEGAYPIEIKTKDYSGNYYKDKDTREFHEVYEDLTNGAYDFIAVHFDQ